MHSRRILYVVAFAMFLLVLLALHYHAFQAPLYYDSTYLQENEHAFASGDPIEVIKLFPQRPVAMVTFYVNYVISGLNPAHFRMVNALLMAGMGLLLLVIIVRLLEISDSSGATGITEKRVIAACLGLFFVAHPVQTYLVLYIWQRMALLSAFFYCSAFLAYLVTRSGEFKPKWAGYALCAVLYVLAMASKENAVTLPVVVILAEIAFLRIGWKAALKQAVLLGVAAMLLVGIFSFLERPHGEIARASGILTTIRQYYIEGEQTPIQVIINQSRMVFHYLALIVFPLPSAVQFISPQVVYRSLSDSPAAIAGVVGAVGFLGLGLGFLRTRPLAGFGMLFFFINLLPEALLVPQYLFISYRAMLPMVGILFVVADGLNFVVAKIQQRETRAHLRIALTALFVAGLGLMASVTVTKSRSWQNPLALWSEVVSHIPADYAKSEKMGIIQSLNNLGVQLERVGRSSEAVSYHLRAAEVAPKYHLTYVALGHAYARLGELENAERAYRKALEVRPDSDKAHVGLAGLLIRQDKLEETKVHLRQALETAPHNPEYHDLLGVLCLKEDKNAEALIHFGKAIESKPDYTEAHFHLGKLFSRMGKTNEAASQYAKVLVLAPSHWQAHNDLGIILARAGRIQDAILHFQEALKANPEDASIKANLGNALKQMGSVTGK